MFHDVCSVENSDPKINISNNNFRDFINELRCHNVKFVGIDEISLNTKCQKFVITFDDVYEGAVLNAIPLLTEWNIPFTLFISPCLIDREGYIMSSQIEELKNNRLCTIGFHTKNHKLMRELYDTEIKNEIDCVDFEKQYGIKCEYFAYPYGSVFACSNSNIEVLEKSKYKAAFGTINSGTNVTLIERHKYYIPRLNICDETFLKFLGRH